MNQAMRGEPDSPELGIWRPVIYHIENALSKLKVGPLPQLYRGMPHAVTGYDEGTFVLWDAFSSSTSDANIVKQFTDEVNCSGTIFILKPLAESHGRCINFLSEFKEESEVLFRPNTWFRVQQKLGQGPKQLLAHHLGISLEGIDVYELEEMDHCTVTLEHNKHRQSLIQLREGQQQRRRMYRFVYGCCRLV